jgi:hypothetical protein
MLFAIFREINKGNTYTYYLQYEGNESNLEWLHHLINESDFSKIFGDCSSYELDLENLVEDVSDVDSVCKGFFNFPWEHNPDEPVEIFLDDLFYQGKIKHYFGEIMYN